MFQLPDDALTSARKIELSDEELLEVLRLTVIDLCSKVIKLEIEIKRLKDERR